MKGPDACALAALHAAGESAVLDTLETTLALVHERDGELGAFAGLEEERALERAAELDRARARGEACGPLFGVPLARKANLCRAGVETHSGSALLAGWTPPFEATALARVEAAGAIVIGATHMDEFGMGSSGENGPFLAARNPWDTTRTAGGSSSGAAAAVAARLVPLALGSDTGGSLRQPASYCGIVGLRPSWGRVSRRGLVAFASSLDQVGPLATSVRDARRVLRIIGGVDARDPTTFEEAAAPRVSARNRRRASNGIGASNGAADLAQLSFGVPESISAEELEPSSRAVIDAALARIEAAGARLVPLALPDSEKALSSYYVIAMAEASSNLARFDGIRFGNRAGGGESLEAMMERTRSELFGTEVKRRLLVGTHALSAGQRQAWYERATDVRRDISADYERIFAEVDFLLCPSAPTPAFPLGQTRDTPHALYAADTWTIPPSLAGLPALSLPAGLVEEGAARLPVGLQMIARRGADEELLAAAERVESCLAFDGRPEASP